MTTTDWIQVAAVACTLMLAALTLWLAWSTRSVAVETRKMAEQSAVQNEAADRRHQDMVRPIIVFTLSSAHTDYSEASIRTTFNWDFALNLKNVGVGPALDVVAFVAFDDRRFEIVVDMGLPRPIILESGEKLDARFYTGYREDLQEAHEYIRGEEGKGHPGTIRVEYRDVLGVSHATVAPMRFGERLAGAPSPEVTLGPSQFERHA